MKNFYPDLSRVKSRERSRGAFSLIEVVVSVGIFLLLIGALVALGLVNSRNLVISKHRLQAVNLAREGVEKITEVRDTAWLNIGVAFPDPYWTNIMTSSGNPCWGLGLTTVPPVTSVRVENYTGVAGSGCAFLHRHLTSGTESMTLQTASDSVTYTRQIQIEGRGPDGNLNPAYRKIIASVSWQDFGTTKTATVVTFLANWKQ